MARLHCNSKLATVVCAHGSQFPTKTGHQRFHVRVLACSTKIHDFCEPVNLLLMLLAVTCSR